MKNSLVTLLAVTVVILAYVIAFGIPDGDRLTKEKQANLEEITIPDVKLQNTDENLADLVGIWQDSESMGSGWSDHYNFYPNGKYSFYFNQMDCSKRTVRRMGGWFLDGNMIVLTTTKEEVLVGGKLVESTGSCGSSMTLEGSVAMEKDLPSPKVEKIKVQLKMTGGNEGKPSIMIGKKQFWKFDNDPTGKGEFAE